MHETKRRAQETYNAAAEFFDEPALGFWDRFGRSTVERLELRPGATVLDACAGAGASALPATERVGPSGKVVAVDLADNLLALARAKADHQGLGNLETRHSDIEALDYARVPLTLSSSCSGCFSSPICRPQRPPCGNWWAQAASWR
jgi:ubiquinone/menaquinone biosynthesis C-methylase UbiE